MSVSFIPPGFARKLDAGLTVPDGREAVYAFVDFDEDRDILPDGTLSKGWEAGHIVRVAMPEVLPYIVPGVKISVVAVHHKAAPPLLRALAEVHAAGLWHMLAPYGGGFVFRTIKGEPELSMHSFGLAIDLNPAANPYHVPPIRTQFGGTTEGHEVVDIFESHGWFWGGRFHSPNMDAMHFQFATGC